MELKQAIEARRSINFFDADRKIDTETIEKILELSALAPSSMNLQPWKVLTVMSDEKKALLRKVSFDQPKVTEASAVFVLLGDSDYIENNMIRTLDSMVELGYINEEQAAARAEGTKNAHGEPGSHTRGVNAVINTSLFAMNLMYACSVYGLETHPMGGFNADDLKKEFGLSDNLIPVILVAAGYLRPGINLLPRVKRLSPNEFNHIL